MQLGAMLNLCPSISQAIAQCQEHWDGKGRPVGLRGEQLSIAARLFRMSHDADIFLRIGGVDTAVAITRQRAGRVYDPRVAERFCTAARSYLGRLQSEATWDRVLAAQPEAIRRLSPPELEGITETIADFVDLRSQPEKLSRAERETALSR